MLDKMTVSELTKEAIEARDKSYSPYSGFSVGAALLAKSGKVYTGANIESATFTPTICAERVAFFTAVHAGEKDFSAIAVVGGKRDEEISSFCPPCGVCRQVMSEFCNADFQIILFDGKENKILSLAQMLPESFLKSNLE